MSATNNFMAVTSTDSPNTNSIFFDRKSEMLTRNTISYYMLIKIFFTDPWKNASPTIATNSRNS